MCYLLFFIWWRLISAAERLWSVILVKKNPIDGPPLNLEIADLSHCRVGALREARQPNGVAVNGTGRKLDGRGFNSRYDQNEDSLWKNGFTIDSSPFNSAHLFRLLKNDCFVLKNNRFVLFSKKWSFRPQN